MESAEDRAKPFIRKLLRHEGRDNYNQWDKDLIEIIRESHADAMRAAAQVGRDTLCGSGTTIPEFRESMVRRIEACADAAAKGFPTPGLVRIGPNVFMRDGETKPEEGGA